MSTAENLKNGFAGESQANRRYLAFAKKAQEEGLSQVAKVFRAAAEAETVHAHAHLAVMNGVKSTAENLKAAIEGEGFEFQEMYPEYIQEAKKEGNKDAVQSFENALAVEKIHFKLYGEALQTLKTGKDLPASDIYVCQVCGNTVLGKAPEVCPICGSPHWKFKEVR
jgi:rubrerythrin